MDLSPRSCTSSKQMEHDASRSIASEVLAAAFMGIDRPLSLAPTTSSAFRAPWARARGREASRASRDWRADEKKSGSRLKNLFPNSLWTRCSLFPGFRCHICPKTSVPLLWMFSFSFSVLRSLCFLFTYWPLIFCLCFSPRPFFLYAGTFIYCIFHDF